MSNTPEALSGVVERITFHNLDNGYVVLRVRAPKHRDLVTVVGTLSSVVSGEYIEARGSWVTDRTHGQQFKARFLRTSAPSSVEGIERYLASGMIRGIGPVYARKMVRAFGEKVFDIIEAVARRGGWHWASTRTASHRSMGRTEDRSRDHGVSAQPRGRHGTRGSDLQDLWRDAIQVMTENPYRLARDIRGIGFKTADAIAIRLGIQKTAMIRIRAGISYALTEAMNEGHCGLPTSELVPLAA